MLYTKEIKTCIEPWISIARSKIQSRSLVKTYIDMNNEKNTKNYYFKLINNAVFVKTIENVTKKTCS